MPVNSWQPWSHDCNQHSQAINAMRELEQDYSNVLIENNYSRIINPPPEVQKNLNLHIYYDDNNPDTTTPMADTMANRAIDEVVQAVFDKGKKLKEDQRTNPEAKRELLGEDVWLKAFLIRGWTDEGGDSHLRP